ncbi:glycosyltransferase [Reichenbachiella sp. MSK19-1]|uniref:glycosyltransferase family 2 protein n=1 Tax=Reichenbachiella sp. MSK19-1 TaxID=1897631 RepID=UPI000E6C32F7|nr:glycosyltransferase [Reichenbachiella sp. MSK19-1]RJE71319.1 glycosyl transferase family 2 [Reichenbachiella sp. MSK19-1]
MHPNDTPLVSIIMAVKDTAPYLHACIDSIIAQTYPHWELIAVNDHSTDDTPAILQAYAAQDSRIRVFDSDRPKLIPTLQVAYAQAKGSLINRMDSDDKMPDYKLDVLVQEWNKYGKGHVIGGGTEHFVDEGEVGDGFRRYERWLNDIARRSAHYEEIYKECVIPSHSWIIHRDDFDHVGAFDPIVYPEDYDLCFRFYRAKLKVIGIDVVLHHWRDRSNRISRTWDEYKDNRYFDLKTRYFYELDRDPSRPLVLWGAGRNGKDMAKILIQHQDTFHWVCDNERKIGKDVYEVRMEHYDVIPSLDNPQIMIVVSSPDGKKEIKEILNAWGKKPVKDYWFFA